MTDEWAAIDEAYTLYASQLLDGERESIEAEISWREREFERLEEMSRKQVPVRFTRPMNGGHLRLLADHPDLLLRYFHNERRIAKAIECCEAQFWHMYLAKADSVHNYYYTEVKKLRRGIMTMMRLELEPVAKILITHIMSRLCALVGVEITNSKPYDLLCLLEDAFVHEVILPNEMLRKEWEDCWKLEHTVLQSHIVRSMQADTAQDSQKDGANGTTLRDLQGILSSRSMAP
ncbi:hypothetical protein DPSP01_012352 [Paraphaeosphaeria sporulosa]